MTESLFDFIIFLQNFGDPLQKNLEAKNMQNLARFRMTSNLRQISPERMNIFKIGQVLYIPTFLPRSAEKNPMNFGPLTTQI